MAGFYEHGNEQSVSLNGMTELLSVFQEANLVFLNEPYRDITLCLQRFSVLRC